MKKIVYLLWLSFTLFLVMCSSANEKTLDQKKTLISLGNGRQEMTCYFFFVADCPASRNNLPKVNQLAEEYRDWGLSVIGVVSDPLLDQQKLKATLEQFGIQFPLIIDDSLLVAKKHGATVTPQVFLYDQDSLLVYSGLLDDYFFSLGKHREKIFTHFLEEAIVSTLINEAVEITETEPIGCKINFNFFQDAFQ